jgi:hypothetical protein
MRRNGLHVKRRLAPATGLLNFIHEPQTPVLITHAHPQAPYTSNAVMPTNAEFLARTVFATVLSG